MDGEGVNVRFADVDRALVQVELSRAKAARSEDEEA